MSSSSGCLLSTQDLKAHNVQVVVRCCDPSYNTDSLTEQGIRVVVSAGWSN